MAGRRGAAPAGLCALLFAGGVAAGCKPKAAGDPGGGYPAVSAYLMPPRARRVEILMERHRQGKGQGKRGFRQPRRTLVYRTGEGALYEVQERISKDRWRTAARLFFAARPDGAFLVRQLDLHGRRVGPREPRLVFPWPLEGRSDPIRKAYTLFRRRPGGSRTVRATVRVVRRGFSIRVGERAFSPCLEVEEVLQKDARGPIQIRSTFCKGAGRLRVVQQRQTPGGGRRTVEDRALGLKILQ